MKHLLIIAGLVVALAGCAQAYDIYIVDPPINKYQLLVDEPLPATYQIGDTLDLMAAPGEYEPASFVVETDKPLVDVRVDCTLLQGEEAALPHDAVDIRLAEWWSVFIHGIGNVATPWILVHDPEMLTVIEETPGNYANLTEEDYVSDTKGGIVPDWGNYPETLEEFKALFPTKNRVLKELIDAQTLQPVDIANREQFWLTVHIPDDAVPGTYTATVQIVPANAPAQKLKLNVWVPDIDLLPPVETYSIYYATHLHDDVDEQQMRLEFENMQAHGCSNPCMYVQHDLYPDGTIDFRPIEEFLRLRREAGMSLEGKDLFLMDGPKLHTMFTTEQMTPEAVQDTISSVQQIVQWADENGYGNPYFMGADEWSGERLRSERKAWQAVHDGGGGIWVATPPSFPELVGDLLDVAVVQPPDSGRADRQQHTAVAKNVLLAPDEHAHWRPESVLVPGWQDLISGVHERGKRIFTYMDPWGSWPLADDHRRVRGFGLWLAGLDGTMTWSHGGIGNASRALSPDDAGMLAGSAHAGGIVMRAKRGVLDTLSWEGYREGYDDSRYIATLLAAGGEEWLKAQSQKRIISGNLDELRRDVAMEILRLQAK